MTTAVNRKTRQRDALRAVLEKSDRPLSVPELLDRASREIDGLGIATVYRAVNALLDDGWLEAVDIPGEPARYERAGKGHHHHFQCRSCDRVFDVGGCIENVRKLVPPKFRVQDHALTLYGVCATCAR
jgi:Fur family transcriptional regulator, ferric uptake regulator